ncbi:phasin family protein [Halopseudomonas bauzanensis]|uniref:Poly(Hydroxyalkanoate) granule-associated protein n=1 Tax=Halopseudomonas bauzanensis TaxID=653930 RepID=A0A1I4LE47_9GAMM|nr:phasin family protein [Halopseudomonas bauzanensis]SER93339.1 poly(hydroxyalkanoate) granule-associated protein [Halopseudomonas bauzanensis]SFL88897.1 poly(hydroxyalkanoate) granule-associated protein [Halopseudomonas bauzanensis]
MADKKKREGKDNDWVEGLEGYSRQIWLAGLGAYTRMGKEGAKLFESLIRDGEQAEKSAKAETGKSASKGTRSKKDPLDGARAKVDKARSKLTDKFGGLEEMFDKRVAGAVERLGLARQEELRALEQRVAELTRAVGQRSTKPAAAAKPTRTARKPATAAAATASSTVIADSVTQAAAEAATPAKATPRRARSAAAKPAASKPASTKAGATAPVKPATRRRATAPKAATRGKSAPAPATDAEPGKPTEQ